MDHGQLQQASANLTCADTPKQLQHVPQVRLNSQMAIAVVIITQLMHCQKATNATLPGWQPGPDWTGLEAAPVPGQAANHSTDLCPEHLQGKLMAVSSL